MSPPYSHLSVPIHIYQFLFTFISSYSIYQFLFTFISSYSHLSVPIQFISSYSHLSVPSSYSYQSLLHIIIVTFNFSNNTNSRRKFLFNFYLYICLHPIHIYQFLFTFISSYSHLSVPIQFISSYSHLSVPSSYSYQSLLHIIIVTFNFSNNTNSRRKFLFNFYLYICLHPIHIYQFLFTFISSYSHLSVPIHIYQFLFNLSVPIHIYQFLLHIHTSPYCTSSLSPSISLTTLIPAGNSSLTFISIFVSTLFTFISSYSHLSVPIHIYQFLFTFISSYSHLSVPIHIYQFLLHIHTSPYCTSSLSPSISLTTLIPAGNSSLTFISIFVSTLFTFISSYSHLSVPIHIYQFLFTFISSYSHLSVPIHIYQFLFNLSVPIHIYQFLLHIHTSPYCTSSLSPSISLTTLIPAENSSLTFISIFVSTLFTFISSYSHLSVPIHIYQFLLHIHTSPYCTSSLSPSISLTTLIPAGNSSLTFISIFVSTLFTFISSYSHLSVPIHIYQFLFTFISSYSHLSVPIHIYQFLFNLSVPIHIYQFLLHIHTSPYCTSSLSPSISLTTLIPAGNSSLTFISIFVSTLFTFSPCSSLPNPDVHAASSSFHIVLAINFFSKKAYKDAAHFLSTRSLVAFNLL